MNRHIAAWALVAVVALGATACSSSPGASGGDTSSSAPAEDPSQPAEEQTVAEACLDSAAALADASQQLAQASAALAQTDADPQATIDAFGAAVDGLKAASESATNQEVKDAFAARAEDYGTLSGLLSKLLIDKDLSVATDFTTAVTGIQGSVTQLQTLCAG